MRKVLIVLLIAVAVAALGILVFGGEARRQTSLKGANVVIVVTDTLRADHLPFYGYEKDTAPFLESIAAKSVVFDRAFSGCSSTAPAMASVFTSLHPSEHGVITGHIATKQLVKNNPYITLNKIPENLRTLGEEFKQAGYKTYGIADNLNISEEMGFWQGFDRFDTRRNEGAEVVNSKLREWIPEIKSSGRYLLYVHYMDPHKPYQKRDPWYVEGATRKERIINAYDSEIRHVDEHLKELFSLLQPDENTLFVFLSDHGEEFWDHGGDGHGKTLYTEVVRVPFLIHHPALPALRVSTAVHTMDLLPTLSELLEFPTNTIWRGQSTGQLIAQKSLGEDRALFSELLRREEHPKPAKRAVVRANRHLIETKNKSGEISNEVYDLAADFKQKNNLVESDATLVANLSSQFQTLDNAVQTPREEIQIAVDEQSLQELKSLGYIE